MSQGNAAVYVGNSSGRRRFGCKGPGAQRWLEAAGLRVPAGANSATLDANGILVARLATSEFLVEAVTGGAAAVESSWQKLGVSVRPGDVYPVTRQDLVVELHGPGLPTLLRQICSVDFAPLLAATDADTGPVILTSMIGVGVVAWPRRGTNGPALTLWLDPSFAHYFWTTLLEVGRSVGSVAIGSTT